MIIADLQHLARPITDLTPLPNNPRRGDVEAVMRSYDQFGQRKPIVARPDGTVIAGNHQLEAARRLGWSEIAVVTVDDDDLTAKAYALADNRTGDLGTYDSEALAEMLANVQIDDQLFEATGYSKADLDALLAEIEPLPTLTGDPDAVPESAPSKTVRGDVWILGPHRLMCGDSTVPTDVEKLMAGKKADAIITDPPYGMNLDTDYSKMPEGTKKSQIYKKPKKYKQVIGDDKAFDASMIRQMFQHTKEQFWFGADYYRSTLSNDDRDGSWMVWDKRKEDGSQDDVIGSTFELCWSANSHQRRILRHYWCGAFGSPEARERVHPTQKPIALLREIINRWTKDGEIIVDLFAGSGSTLMAAHQTGRICYTMELDEHYCDVICKRFQQAAGIKPIAEATGNEHDFLAE